MKFLFCICLISGLVGCTNGFQTRAPDAVTGATSTSASNNQWHADTLNGSACSGIYQMNANGSMMVITIFANQSGQFSGVAAVAGQGNQSVTGTCANNNISFTLAGVQYTGTLN
jgi:hypothetical protein